LDEESNLPIPFINHSDPSLLSLTYTSAYSFSTTATPRSIPSSVLVTEVFVDACPHGIGFSLDDRWLAWTFARNHPDIPRGRTGSIKMSWAELLAVELCVGVLLAAGYSNTKIRLRSDHKGVVKALKKGRWAKKEYLDVILQRILGHCQSEGLVLEPAYIWTRKNPADKPSRGVYPPDMMFEYCPPVPQHLVEFLHLVPEPPVPNEKHNPTTFWKFFKRRARNRSNSNVQGQMPESPSNPVDLPGSVESQTSGTSAGPPSGLEEPKESMSASPTSIQAHQHSSGSTSAYKGVSQVRTRSRLGHKSSATSLHQIAHKNAFGRENHK